MSVIRKPSVHSMQNCEMVNFEKVCRFSVQLHNNIVQLLELEFVLQSEKAVGLEAQKGAWVLYKKGGVLQL